MTSTMVIDSFPTFSTLTTPLGPTSDSSNGSSTCFLSSDIALSSDTTTTTNPNSTPPADSAALRRLSDNLDSLFDTVTDDDTYSDAVIHCDRSHRKVSVHRCILSSRSPFFKSLFAAKSREKKHLSSSAATATATSSKHRVKDKEKEKEREKAKNVNISNGNVNNNNNNVNNVKESSNKYAVRLEVKELSKEVEVSFDSVVAVIGYLYSGKVRPLPKAVCICVDDECSHLACRPAVDFLVEVLYLAHTFHIAELVALYQRHLLDIIDKVGADDLLIVLSIANMCGNTCDRLLGRCIEMIVRSDVDVTTLERSLPLHIVNQIIELRKEIGLTGPGYDESPDRHVKRIHRALESDDVELVRMLLKEGHATLDDAYALHYAVAHCDAKTTTELLELNLADVNLRNQRGYTVLHVAAMRKEPKIILALLTKGAQPIDVTMDNRNALQIAKRLTKAVDFYNSTEQGKDSPKERLCIEILEQAGRREPMLGEGSVSLAKAGEDLRMKLLYLENRVALARLLFPMEAKVAMDIAQVDGTSEFTLSKNIAEAQRKSVDLNEAPFILKEEYLQRMRALSKTVELGKRFFPRCSDVLNKIMDADDLSQLAYLGNDTAEERQRKKRRYLELQEALTKAFTEDKEEFDRSTLSSSSSTAMAKSHGKANFKRYA